MKKVPKITRGWVKEIVNQSDFNFLVADMFNEIAVAIQELQTEVKELKKPKAPIILHENNYKYSYGDADQGITEASDLKGE